MVAMLHPEQPCADVIGAFVRSSLDLVVDH